MIRYEHIFTVMHTEKARSAGTKHQHVYKTAPVDYFGSLHYWSVGMYVCNLGRPDSLAHFV